MKSFLALTTVVLLASGAFADEIPSPVMMTLDSDKNLNREEQILSPDEILPRQSQNEVLAIHDPETPRKLKTSSKADIGAMLSNTGQEEQDTHTKIQRMISSEESGMQVTARDPNKVSNPIRMNPFINSDGLGFTSDPSR